MQKVRTGEDKPSEAIKWIRPVYRQRRHNTTVWPQTLAGATESDTADHMTRAMSPTEVPQVSQNALFSVRLSNMTGYMGCKKATGSHY